tara:strand:- start:1886 stop:2068 length:183 start_codon:yes stop_codon:yes gene_type:complete
VKYKNKDGIELSFTGNDSLSVLVREVVGEAVSMLKHNHAQLTIKFLKENFDIKDNNESTS